jgi:ATP-dependent protease ClpP protease subunit
MNFHISMMRVFRVAGYLFILVLGSVLSAEVQSKELSWEGKESFKKCLNKIDSMGMSMSSSQLAKVEKYHNVLCIAGDIGPGLLEAVGEILGYYKKSDNIAVIINSSGGEVGESIKLGRLIEPFKTTVFAYQYCSSSCANYVFAAGDRRIVLPGALLMFHGGATLNSLETVAKEVYEAYGKAGQEGAEKNIEQIRKQITSMVKQQEEYMDELGIGKHIFRWMDIFNYMPNEDKRKLCPDDPVMVIYDPGILEKFGYRIDKYKGPRSQKEVNRRLSDFGVKRNVCYWRHESYLVQ